jgi:hypothetical protein
MGKVVRRLGVVIGVASAPMAFVTAVSPGVSRADCAYGQVWDGYSNSCQWQAPQPPPPVPVTMCIGAPVPFVPLSWCFPVAGG